MTAAWLRSDANRRAGIGAGTLRTKARRLAGSAALALILTSAGRGAECLAASQDGPALEPPPASAGPSLPAPPPAQAPLPAAAQGAAATPCVNGNPSESTAAVRDARLSRRPVEALRKLDAFPPCARTPVTRYVRARLLVAAERYGEAAAELIDLELALPELGAEIRRARGEAQEQQRDVDQMNDAEHVLSLARHALSAGDDTLAKRALDRAASLGTEGQAAGDLRALRSQWAIRNKDRYRAYLDWRWLLLQEPTHRFAPWAEAQLKEHYPQNPLSREERLARLKVFRDRGRSDLLEGELGELSQMQPRLNDATAARYRGMTAYTARRYGEAAVWLLKAAELPGLHVPETRYYAGRALLRSGRFREAQQQFELVAADPPKRSLTAMALFRLAQAKSFAGDWPAAAATYTRQLEQYPGSEVDLSARRELAIALFGAGEVERSANAWLNLRASEAGSGDVPLYGVLESIAREEAGEQERADALLKHLTGGPALGFATFRARTRLGVAQPTPEAVTVEPARPSLPPVAAELEAFGFIDEAETVAGRLRSVWYRQFVRDGATEGDTPHLFGSLNEAECRATASLTHARRRLLVGLDQARAAAFFERPDAAPRWLWECVYPAPYAEWVTEAAVEFDVPQSLIYAIMRQESGFRPHVASPADAHGLMQIIPPTAREIAEALNVPYEEGMLYDPHVNIRFGAYYLSHLLARFGNHPAAAAAGYNAGPEITTVWLHAGWQLPLEMFAARIPYTETRNYVQRVLSNMLVYEVLYPSSRALGVATYFPESASRGDAGHTAP